MRTPTISVRPNEEIEWTVTVTDLTKQTANEAYKLLCDYFSEKALNEHKNREPQPTAPAPTSNEAELLAALIEAKDLIKLFYKSSQSSIRSDTFWNLFDKVDGRMQRINTAIKNATP